jgi:glycosyltransferase involved in cell wall biosynthesis
MLRRALASVRAQRGARWEAIVVDDGDGEGIDLVASLGDPRIVALPSAGTGQVDARTTAIGRARGSFVCWLDDDDWWDDAGHLALLAARSAEGPGFFYRGGWIVRGEAREAFDHDATPASLRENNTVLTSSIAYRTESHRLLGPLDRALDGYCDWDYLLRLCEAGFPPRKLPGLGVCYEVHETNASKAYDRPSRRAAFERFKAKHDLDVEIANHEIVNAWLTEA